MRPLDTSEEAWRRQVERWQDMSGAEKVESARQLRRSALALFKVGIRDRHPDYTGEQIHLAVMRRILGGELYQKAFSGKALVEP